MRAMFGDCVEIWPEAVEGKIYGSLMIKRGLKRRARKREL
jgi:integrase